MRSILTVQRDIAQAVAQQVRVKLSPQQQARLGAGGAVDPAAYDAFLRGRYYLMTQYSKPQGLDTAQRYYEEAIRRDSKFAPAYTGLADTWLNQGLTGHVSSQVAYRAAKDAVNKALVLGGNTGEAHMILAMLSWMYDWDPVTAEREFHDSLALAPSYDCGHEYYSGYLAWRHRREESLAEITRARELNPSEPRVRRIGVIFSASRLSQFDRSQSQGSGFGSHRMGGALFSGDGLRGDRSTG